MQNPFTDQPLFETVGVGHEFGGDLEAERSGKESSVEVEARLATKAVTNVGRPIRAEVPIIFEVTS